jgi:hemerythrin
MAIAIWKVEYLTGDLQVDQDHQKLFAIVNALHDAILLKAEYAVLQEILQQLAAHTVAHFQTEERLMQAYAYIGFDRHKQVHDGLLAKMTSLLQQLEAQQRLPTVQLTEFLTEWLAHHIKGEDQKMIQFFQAQAAPTHPIFR